MNIITRPHGSDLCYCRPDTTWERENKDFYVPDNVRMLYWAPIVFARISKAGKCIGGKFVQRYYDAWNYGILLYCDMMSDHYPEGSFHIAFASCADHTSRLPYPLHDVETLQDGHIYKVYCNGEEIFGAAADKALIEDTICKASQITSLRIGDFVAVELDEAKPIVCAGEKEMQIEGRFMEKDIYGFRLIF